MKRSIIVLLGLALLAACSKGGGDLAGRVTSVYISNAPATLAVGAKVTLTYFVNPLDAPDQSVTWKSNNTNRATVDSSTGEVTGVGAGVVTITVTTNDGRKTDSCDITIEQPGAGTGIATAADLRAFAAAWDAATTDAQRGEVIKAWSDNGTSTGTVKLLQNIDLGGTAGNTSTYWTPIGVNPDQEFSGKFEGNGKTISNMMIVSPAYGYAGLFANVKGTTISNLTIDGAKISGICGHSGTIAATISNTKVIDCHVTNTTITFNEETTPELGGIVGYMSSGTIDGCSFEGIITSGATAVAPGVGGIAGSTGTPCFITGCHTGKSTRLESNIVVGGIVGSAGSENCTVVACYSNGSIKGKYEGGIMGSVMGRHTAAQYNVVGCYSLVSMSQTTDIAYGLISTTTRNHACVGYCFWLTASGVPAKGIGFGTQDDTNKPFTSAADFYTAGTGLMASMNAGIPLAIKPDGHELDTPIAWEWEQPAAGVNDGYPVPKRKP